MAAFLDEAYYLKSKLAQLQAEDSATYGKWTTAQVKQAIEDAGMTVQQHYEQYSMVEGTSPNAYFNTMEYLEAKAAQLNSWAEGGKTDWDAESVAKAFQEAGLTPEQHYQMYGCKEADKDGNLINPSNAFDANAYVQAKLAQLVATDPDTYGNWNAAQVVEAIADAGLTPVEHFEDYGKAEGADAGIAMLQTVPVVDRVTNDELRDAMNENVPSNYNKPVDAPKNVTASEAAAVDKPCDMGASTTTKPADPVKVPGDSGYVAVPGGGIKDTAANPVELVSETITDATGKEVTIAQYGVQQTATTDDDGNKTQEVAAVDKNGAVDTTADAIKTTTTNADGSVKEEVKVESAKGSVEKTTTDDGKGNTTEEVSGKLADNSTYEASKTQTTASDGTVTKAESVATTDKDGNTGAGSASSSVVNKDGQVLSEMQETTNADGTKTKTEVENTYNSDGSVTSTETKTDTAADGTSTETKTTETVDKSGDQVGDKVETVTEKDANGKITEQTTTTTDESGKSDGGKDTTSEAQAEQAAEQGGSGSSGGSTPTSATGTLAASFDKGTGALTFTADATTNAAITLADGSATVKDGTASVDVTIDAAVTSIDTANVTKPVVIDGTAGAMGVAGKADGSTPLTVTVDSGTKSVTANLVASQKDNIKFTTDDAAKALVVGALDTDATADVVSGTFTYCASAATTPTFTVKVGALGSVEISSAKVYTLGEANAELGGTDNGDTLSVATLAASSVKLGDGTDTLTLYADAATTVDLGAGKDTLTIDANKSNGTDPRDAVVSVNLGVMDKSAGDNVDTITGFTAGAGKDKLVFAKDSVGSLVTTNLGTAIDLTQNANVADNEVRIVTGRATLTDANFAKEDDGDTSAYEIIMAAGNKAYFLATSGTGATGETYNVYNVQASAADGTTGAVSYTVDLVGTLNTVTGTFDAGNFGVATE